MKCVQTATGLRLHRKGNCSNWIECAVNISAKLQKQKNLCELHEVLFYTFFVFHSKDITCSMPLSHKY